jgi:para-nitrobenzyl esterase
MKTTNLIKILTYLILLGIAASAFSQTFTSPRYTEGGLVSGIIENGVEIYKGIPYAGDTGGDNRWHPPPPAEPWDGILQADTFGPVCTQHPASGPLIIGSEDCLSLNIYVPEGRSNRSPHGKKKPVMVWIHGGSWKQGAGSIYDGTQLAKKGVVLVTINYRLDFLGRFAHPAVSASQQGEHLGNYALMDQIAALQWVQRNIRAFGGHPKKVTIFGHSAGGEAVSHLMVTPDSEGLFRNAISQSGGVSVGRARFIDRRNEFNPVSLEDLGSEVASFFDIPDDENAPAALRSLSPRQLLVEFPDVENSMTPVVDHTLVTEPVAESYYHGRQHRANYIGGGTSDDFGFFRFFGIPLEAVLLGFDIDGVRALYPDFAGADFIIASLWSTDLIPLGSTKFLAQQMYKVQRRGYFFYFDYTPTADRPSFFGVLHGGELPFLFGNLPFDATAEDMEMSEKIMTAWTNFAKHSDANNYEEVLGSLPALNFQWLPTSKWYDNTTVIDIDGIHAERDFEEIKPQMDFIIEGFEQALQN